MVTRPPAATRHWPAKETHRPHGGLNAANIHLQRSHDVHVSALTSHRLNFAGDIRRGNSDCSLVLPRSCFLNEENSESARGFDPR